MDSSDSTNLTNLQQSNQQNPLHQPIMVAEILAFFSPVPTKKRYFDGTFGRGGHARAIQATFPDLEMVLMDKDPSAICVAVEEFKNKFGNVTTLHRAFSTFNKSELGEFDLALLDLGVSSPQLDQGERGFSFYHEGPLDMRMDNSKGASASEILQSLSENELNKIFIDFGEIQKPWRVTRAIVHDRRTTPFETTRALASLIERVDGWRIKGHHPATRYFQALRMYVNDEVGELETALPKVMEGLSPGGRLAVLTFHSIEDRIVKNLFRNSQIGKPVNKKVVQASPLEIEHNPRSRSAKLRVFERGVL